MASKLYIKGHFAFTTGVFRRLLRGHEEWMPAIIKRALTEAARIWRDNELWDHFEMTAHSKYPGKFKTKVTAVSVWGKRSSHYWGQGRHRRPEPMWKSGTFRRNILNGALRFKVYKSPRRLQVDMKLPFTGPENFWTGGRRRHDFHEMLPAMTHAQRRAIRDYVRQRTLDLLRDKLTMLRFVRSLDSSGYGGEMNVYV